MLRSLFSLFLIIGLICSTGGGYT